MINENKIREACASNRERGFKMLMDSFQVPIYNYIRRLVVSHEDAEDVLQEVFIRVFRHIDQFREESSLSTWIYRIATNESLRLLNGRKDEGVVSAEDVQEELMGKLKASDYIDYENELAVKFQEAILSLPEKQRLVFNLRYYDELEYEEIARVLDSKVDTLKVNYHYAKEKIKEIATKEQKDAMKEMFRMVDKSKVDEVKQMLEYTQKGTAKATVGNYMVVLRNDPLVRESMKYNKLTLPHWCGDKLKRDFPAT